MDFKRTMDANGNGELKWCIWMKILMNVNCRLKRYFGKMANPALKFGSTKCDTIIYMFMQHESLL